MNRPESNAKPKAIPEPSLRRLPIYYHLLQAMLAEGVTHISTTGIAGPLQLDPTQVRKDLEAAGMIGKPKVGYSLEPLIRRIEEFLGWDQTKEAVLVGAGSLGTALLGYRRFRQFGFHLIAAFDTDPDKTGLTIAGTEVFPLERLAEFCSSRKIRLGVITTPPGTAQSVAISLVDAGIRAIWNFAPVHLQVPPFVLLQNEDLYRSLASLSYRLEQMLAAERASVVLDPEPAH
ncbi:MAG TPA: redox-sensing transcriptional repressor Rex [Bryobacteraceae bacterium]|nr:redox-sensing transcriptional repressor Rex [Bryobacteraceae bacterium]